MPFSTLSLAVEGEVAVLRLSTRRGALPPAFWRELPAALGQLQGARALLVTGAGADFSTGLDLAATAPLIAEVAARPGGFMGTVREMQGALEALAALPIASVAAISGWCIGAGLELACACDLRLASAEARFSLPEVKLGLVADLGGLGRLPRLIGEGPARWLALTGEPIGAAEALRLGLLGEVLDTPEALHERAWALARTLAAHPPRAVQGSKRVLNERLPHAEGLAQAARWNAEHLDLRALTAGLRPAASEPPPVQPAEADPMGEPAPPPPTPPAIGRHAARPGPPPTDPPSDKEPG